MNKQTLRNTIFIGLFLVPFIPFLVSSLLFFPFITTKVFVWRIIVEIVFAAWILLALTDTEYRPKKSPVLYAVLGFLGVMGLTTVFGVDPLKSFWSNFERMEGYISLLHLGAFFLVAGSMFREVDWKRWWNTSLVASALMVVYAFFQLTGTITIHQGGVRVDGTFGNATYLAVYMLIHIFVAALFLYRARKDVAMRWTYGLLIFGQVAILYNTATRGAILGLLGGLIITALLNVRNREPARHASPVEAGGDKFARKASISLLTGLAVVVGGFLLFKDTSFIQESPVLSRFVTITTDELKTGGRSFVWPMALEGFKERPILGWGQENFVYVFQENYSPDMYHLEPWFDRAHNIFLDWMVAGGILGLLAYLSLYAASLYLIWRRDQETPHLEKSLLTGLLAAYFFHNFFVFDHLVSYILFFSLLAYLYSRNTGELLWHRSFEPISARRITLPVVSIFLVLALYFVNIKPLMANIFLIEALKSVQLGEFEKAGNYFARAYHASFIGKQEVVQHMTTNAVPILQSNLSLEKKNEFYAFAKEAMVETAEHSSNEAKIQLTAGSFLSTVGAFEEALEYLARARELMPNKQDIYLEIANVYLNAGNKEAAIETLRVLSEISPAHKEQAEEYITQIERGEL